MNLKATTFILALLVLSNCNTVTTKDKKKEIESSIIGDWTNCKREYNDGSIMMGNVCLKLLFNKDHSGIAMLGGIGGKKNFTWTINADTLSFKNVAETKHQLYADGQYKLTEQTVKTGRTIIMYDIANKVKYYLNR